MKHSPQSSFLILVMLLFGNAQAELSYLAARNTQAPFPYLQEGARNWLSLALNLTH
jgi:hypothetical protein